MRAIFGLNTVRFFAGVVALGFTQMAQAAPAAATPAVSDKPCALTKLTSVQMETMNNGLIMAPVAINNTAKYMLVDTGGFVTQLWAGVASKMNLPVQNGGAPLTDVNGNSSSQRVAINQFGIGGLHADNVNLQVYPTADVNVGDDRVAGLIGPDMLVNFDIDLDFGSNTLSYFSQDHCDGKVQWQGSDVAAIPFTMQGGHITLPVVIDGQMMNAIIDTGSANTVVNLDTAGRVFNLTAQSAGMKSLGHMPGNMYANLYKHSFGDMSFAGVSIKSPSVTLMPDLSHGNLPDVIIGMDVLKNLHLYVAFGQKMIYVSKTNSSGFLSASNKKSGLVTIAMN